MARKTFFELSFPSVEKYFDSLKSKSFSERILQDIFYQKRFEWKIPESKKATQFISFLEKKGVLFLTTFTNEEDNNKVIGSWKTHDDLTIMSGLKTGAYFSHYSAMFMHQLTLQIPKTYYLNFEHYALAEPRAENPVLTQENIDKAFSKPQRKSSISYTFKEFKVFIINGKNTGKLGVLKREDQERSYEYTDLERTLIDIAIRPVYAGGVFEVLEAYKKAKEEVDIKRLKEYLVKMDFIYPYHQVIGFYLEKAGYPEKYLSLFNTNKDFKFFLTYDIRNKEFSSRWQIYYPKGF